MFLEFTRVEWRQLGFEGVAVATAAPTSAETEQRRARVWGFSARLEPNSGAFESWEDQVPNARTGASTGASSSSTMVASLLGIYGGFS